MIFKVASTKIEATLRGGTHLPKRKRRADSEEPVFNTARYWDALTLKMPELSLVVRVGTAACATEAATDRMFSHEAIMHDRIKNKLKPNVVEAVIKVRVNYERIADIVHRTGVHANEFEHLVHPHDAVIDEEVVHVDVSDSSNSGD
jgi:hypothetical protein